MRRVLISALVLAVVGGTAAAQPFENFFNFQEPRLPRGGECTGAGWYGEFAGRRWDHFRERYEPVSTRGCFGTEAECRTFNHQAITYLDGGPMLYATCKPFG